LKSRLRNGYDFETRQAQRPALDLHDENRISNWRGKGQKALLKNEEKETIADAEKDK
jgi:hypothetical protein